MGHFLRAHYDGGIQSLSLESLAPPVHALNSKQSVGVFVPDPENTLEQNYSGRGWKLVSWSGLRDAPVWITAPVSAIGALIVCGLVICLLARGLVALAVGSADDVYKILLTLAGAIGAPFVAWRTLVAHQQTIISRESHFTTLFTRAVEQLGATREVKGWDPGSRAAGHEPGMVSATEPNLEVRLGAIYALERIAQDSERDHWPIMEVLCAYIRNSQNTGSPVLLDTSATAVAARQEINNRIRPCRVDVQAAINVIGRRSSARIAFERKNDHSLDLHAANLQRARVAGNFALAQFGGANLTGTTFVDANCQKANFGSATGTFPMFSNVLLKGADFSYSKIDEFRAFESALDESVFSMARVSDAIFIRSTARGAKFLGSNLSHCKFEESILTEGDFSDSRFWEVMVAQCDLTATKWDGTQFYKSFLFNVDLSRAIGLTSGSFEGVFADASTSLSRGLDRPVHWSAQVLTKEQREALFERRHQLDRNWKWFD